MAKANLRVPPLHFQNIFLSFSLSDFLFSLSNLSSKSFLFTRVDVPKSVLQPLSCNAYRISINASLDTFPTSEGGGGGRGGQRATAGRKIKFLLPEQRTCFMNLSFCKTHELWTCKAFKAKMEKNT